MVEVDEDFVVVPVEVEVVDGTRVCRSHRCRVDVGSRSCITWNESGRRSGLPEDWVEGELVVESLRSMVVVD